MDSSTTNPESCPHQKDPHLLIMVMVDMTMKFTLHIFLVLFFSSTFQNDQRAIKLQTSDQTKKKLILIL